MALDPSELVQPSTHVEIIGVPRIPTYMRTIKINGIEVMAESISVQGHSNGGAVDDISPVTVTVKLIPDTLLFTDPGGEEV